MNTTLRPAVVTVGHEILYGERRNDNQEWMLHTLWARHIPARIAVCLGDHHDAIAAAVRDLQASDQQPVFVSGGLGGTHDDVTRAAIADALDVELVQHPACLELLKMRYGDRFTAQRQRMAMLPAGCGLIPNADGAPGFQLDHVYAFPGFPGMLRQMLPWVLDEALRIPPTAGWQVIEVVLPVTEGAVAIALEEFSQRHPQAELGIYPDAVNHRREITLRLRLPANDESTAAAFEHLLGELAVSLGIKISRPQRAPASSADAQLGESR